MKLKIYAVKDRQTDMYGQPMFLMTDGHAMRAFSDEINRASDDNMLHKHPDDFDLYKLGVWDGNAGRFETHEPEQLVLGKTVKT